MNLLQKNKPKSFRFSRLLRYLPAALTVFMLSGCSAQTPSGSEDSAQQSSGSEDSAEQTSGSKDNTQQTPSGSAQSDTGTSADTKNFAADESQSFTVDLAPLGEIEFCTLAPKDPIGSGRDALFQIKKDGSAIQTLDDSYTAATMFFSKVEAVSFTDYNGDGYDDIIIVSSYDISGGPDTGTGTSAVKFYKASENGTFIFDQALSENANNSLTDFTISAAKEYAQKFVPSALPDPIVSDSATLCRRKYREALHELMENLVFPNGEPADDTFLSEPDFSYGEFAVCDIDSDGAEELLIYYSDATMVGMIFYIFEYDTDTDSFHEEFAAFPAVVFYENGYIKAEISHNQGLAGNFWPYSILKYDSNTDTYLSVAYIDAWDEKTFPTDFNGNAFPAEADTSNSGFVYYIYRDGVVSDKTQPAPADVTEYNRLLDETYGNCDEVQIDYRKITEENINQI